MELMKLSGNTLKVYLALVAMREAGDRCLLSQRALSRRIHLSRDTVSHAFHQLVQQGLIVPQTPGWWVRTEPLEWLLPPWRDKSESTEMPALTPVWN